MSSELDELRNLIDLQYGQQPNPADIPLHGKGVSPPLGAPGDDDAVRITVTGEARQGEAGALVVDAAGVEIGTDLERWPDGVLGARVEVTGVTTPATQAQGLQRVGWRLI